MKVKAENHPGAGVAFITGGGGGIGGATAERLAANGVSVVVADFNADRLPSLALDPFPDRAPCSVEVMRRRDLLFARSDHNGLN